MKMSLEEQIIKLHSELEAVIAAYVDERAAQVARRASRVRRELVSRPRPRMSLPRNFGSLES